MTILLVGFDSAWTSINRGAMVGVLFTAHGFKELGAPLVVNYQEAERKIQEWQSDHRPEATIIMVDQPIIVNNAAGQRPVENIAGSAVSRRRGGMQPANTGKENTFGRGAPVWPFLGRFGGPGNPLEPLRDTLVLETYPALALIALGWTLNDSRLTGRLPKYNPKSKKKFSALDWQHVCGWVTCEFRKRGLADLVRWLEKAGLDQSPVKGDQDCLDACICLLAALHLVEQKECMMVGDLATGYIVVPWGKNLSEELKVRCVKTGRNPADWVRSFRLRADDA